MTASHSHPITACQICGSADLASLLFLGYVPPVNTMPPLGERADEQPAFPLELLRCGDCGLVQIGQEVSAEVLFPHSYPYLSGTTKILSRNFADLQAEAQDILGLSADDLVIDVGSNDGTLLANFHTAGNRVLGIEPSQAGDVARRNGIETLTAYFGRETAARVAESHGTAKLVTAANVFAHIAQPHEVTAGIVDLLAPDGVFVSESHYLLDLVQTVQYDTIYHEHLRYYALGSLMRLLGDHGLEVFHVKRIPTHGGSIRVYAARPGTYDVRPSVAERLADEAAAGITDGSALQTFREAVVRSKVELYALLNDIRKPGVRIVGIGAPSRASTLIAYTGLDDGMVEAVLEVSSSHKLNKYIPGTRIPVVDEAMLFDEQPDYALLLSWHIADELAEVLRRKGYRGRFIAPLPTPRIIE
ncbi:class I SAM-dependent methyltransferase [Roseospira navarrensis]|uniref:Methyltransferase domain-containing protein n=1 Tax=Roseospira navarrensis TaxID=140058 RepID=A0A7X2D3H9_9PROT|nr:class I SAM-dependent methyltransferase [Roseospira navarrensis]MQX37419.1 methyltransferase domain-containing protein [Roseospira navarrensis]